MLYADYRVTDCGLTDTRTLTGFKQEIYFCNLIGSRHSHKIDFQLVIHGCAGEAKYLAQYEAVAPHIKVGDLLHCEFAYQWHNRYLNLCLSGLAKVVEEQYGSVGEWMRFPGLIHCGGDAFIHLDFTRSYPEFGSYDVPNGALVWKSEPQPRMPSLIRRFVDKFVTAY